MLQMFHKYGNCKKQTKILSNESIALTQQICTFSASNDRVRVTSSTGDLFSGNAGSALCHSCPFLVDFRVTRRKGENIYFVYSKHRLSWPGRLLQWIMQHTAARATCGRPPYVRKRRLHFFPHSYVWWRLVPQNLAAPTPFGWRTLLSLLLASTDTTLGNTSYKVTCVRASRLFHIKKSIS